MNIVANSMNDVEFDMFVWISDNDAMLDQQTLLQALKVCWMIILGLFNFLCT